MRYVIDTNIWIFYLRKNQQVRQHLRQALTNHDEICIIPIVYFELLRGLRKRNDLGSIEQIRKLWRTLPYYEATRTVWDTAIIASVLSRLRHAITAAAIWQSSAPEA